MAGESCDDSCAGLSHTGRKVRSSFAILELIGHSYCVTVIKHLMSLRRIKVTNEPKDASTACKSTNDKELCWVSEMEWGKSTPMRFYR